MFLIHATSGGQNFAKSSGDIPHPSPHDPSTELIVPALFSKSLQLANLSGLGEKAVVDIQLTRDAFFAWV